MLESCPFVLSVGFAVNSGMNFLRLPDQFRYYIKDYSKFQFKTNEENLIRATRIEENVPYFARSFDFIARIFGEVDIGTCQFLQL